jgi:hypothetical protein
MEETTYQQARAAQHPANMPPPLSVFVWFDGNTAQKRKTVSSCLLDKAVLIAYLWIVAGV